MRVYISMLGLLSSYIVINPLHQVDYVGHGWTISVGIVYSVSLVISGSKISDTAGSRNRRIAFVPDAAMDQIRHIARVSKNVLRVSSVLDDTHLFFELSAHKHYRKIGAAQLLRRPVVNVTL